MGLSVHYSGEFKKEASLSEMIEEVRDIAEIYQWDYHIYQDSFPLEAYGKKEYTQDIYGISFTPPNCETVSFEFLSNGRMSSSTQIMQ